MTLLQKTLLFHFRLVGNFDYAVNQLWGKKEKAESIQLVPSKKAKGVKNWEKVVKFYRCSCLLYVADSMLLPNTY